MTQNGAINCDAKRIIRQSNYTITDHKAQVKMNSKKFSVAKPEVAVDAAMMAMDQMERAAKPSKQSSKDQLYQVLDKIFLNVYCPMDSR